MSTSPKTLSAIFDYPNNHATSTLDRLMRDREDVQVQYFYWNDFPDFRRNNDWKIPAGATRLSVRHPWRLWTSFGKIRRSDNVYFQSFSSPRIWMALLFWGVILFGRCQKVFLASEGMKKKPSKFTKSVISRLLNSSRVIHLGIGHRSGQNFFDAGMRRWMFRKYCFCEEYPAQQIESKNGRAGPLRILSIGQLIERKNHQMLLDAIAGLNRPDQAFAQLAGDGPLAEQLKRRAGELGIEEQVSFLGFCSHDQLNDLMLQADVFVLLSQYDGWGVVVGHALNYGLPIIVSEGVRAGRDFLVEPEVNGFICTSTNELTEQLNQLIEHPERLAGMRKSSLQKAELWNIRTTSQRLGMLIDDVEVKFESGPLSPAVIERG